MTNSRIAKQTIIGIAMAPKPHHFKTLSADERDYLARWIIDRLCRKRDSISRDEIKEVLKSARLLALKIKPKIPAGAIVVEASKRRRGQPCKYGELEIRELEIYREENPGMSQRKAIDELWELGWRKRFGGKIVDIGRRISEAKARRAKGG